MYPAGYRYSKDHGWIEVAFERSHGACRKGQHAPQS
jgi:hypothetical protein